MAANKGHPEAFLGPSVMLDEQISADSGQKLDKKARRKQERAERRAKREANRAVREAAAEETGVVSTPQDNAPATTPNELDERANSTVVDDDTTTNDDLLNTEEEQQEGSDGVGFSGPLVGPVATAVVAKSAAEADLVFASLQQAFAADRIDIVAAGGQPDLVVDLVNPHAIAQAPGAVCTILVGQDGMAPDIGSHVRQGPTLYLPFGPVAFRYGQPVANGVLGPAAAGILALAVRDLLLYSRSGVLRPSKAERPVASDLAEALKLSKHPSDLLKALSWPQNLPPKSLRVVPDPANVAHFIDGEVSLGKGENNAIPYYFPFEWDVPRRGRSAKHMLYGLGFVTEALSYWQIKAAARSSEKFAAVDAEIKKRGITASSLLTAAGAVILDCARGQESLPDVAWQAAALHGRARACELFLLCCRIASERRIVFDRAMCGEVYRVLLGTLERLRVTVLAMPGTRAGVTQAALLLALAIPLRRTSYGKLLMQEVREALISIHLATGMSPDGVWKEGLAQHASVFKVLSALSADMRSVEGRKSSLSDTLRNLAHFLDGVLSADGLSPALFEAPPTSYGKIARAARAHLKAAGKASAATAEMRPFAFPGGGFFISKTAPDREARVSQVVVQARSPAEGGPSLCFSVGAHPLLIGGGTTDEKAPALARKLARESPASHNAIRVNGRDYTHFGQGIIPDVRIEQVWENQHWSAVSLLMGTTEATMRRTAIHLKPVHALLVIDDLKSEAQAASFEQFWHLSSRLRQEKSGQGEFLFLCPGGGVLNAHFDPDAGAQLHEGGEDGIGWSAFAKREVSANPYLVRRRTGERVLMASYFRWSTVAALSAIELRGEGPEGWRALLRGGESQIAFLCQDGQLTLQK